MLRLQHPIQVVSRLTGLSPHVIRVWERRYRAVTPERTPTNRRLYSEDEVERLQLLGRATEAGHKIGIIARLELRDLKRLVLSVLGRQPTEKEADRPSASAGSARPGIEIDAQDAGTSTLERPSDRRFIVEAVEAIQRFDSDRLVQLLTEGVLRLGQNGALLRLICPLAHEMGERWERGEMTAAQEHFASVLVREFLMQGTRPYALEEHAPRAIVATPSGQLHELGAVVVAVLAATQGWRPIYLGPSLPAAEIARVAIQNRARAILLSIVYPADDPQLTPDLLHLRRLLPEDTRIVVGGRAAPSYRLPQPPIGALAPENLQGLVRILQDLRAPGSPPAPDGSRSPQ